MLHRRNLNVLTCACSALSPVCLALMGLLGWMIVSPQATSADTAKAEKKTEAKDNTAKESPLPDPVSKEDQEKSDQLYKQGLETQKKKKDIPGALVETGGKAMPKRMNRG